MRSERIGCEAPVHAPGCECQNCTKRNCEHCPNHTLDHFSAKSIARKLGWTENEINSPKNWQYLSPSCHREKDRNTNLVLQELQEQHNGRFIGLGEHVQIGLKNYET